MEMTENEILRSYNEAKDKKEQVKILADLNQTTPGQIATILRYQGVDGRAFQWLHPAGAKKAKETTPAKKATTQGKTQTAPRIKPRIEHEFDRMAELFAAIHERIAAHQTAPTAWLDEFEDLWALNAQEARGTGGQNNG